MTVVVDSSALITLARIGRLELPHQIAGDVHIPAAVFVEVVQRGGGRAGTVEVAGATWIHRRDARDVTSVGRLGTRVGRGEAEAIVLAKELGADILVIDDAVARRVAEAEGQRVVGLTGLLIHGKEQGVVAEIKPVLDSMRAAGFFLDDSRYESLLRRAGE